MKPHTPPFAESLLVVVGALNLLPVLAGLGGGLSWSMERLAHWLPLTSATCLLWVLLLAWRRRWGWAALLLGAVLGELRSASWATPPQPTGEQAVPSLYYANVLRVNADPSGVATQIQETDPDLVLLLEVDREWLEALAPTLEAYPFRTELPLDNNFGMALYSRHPMETQTLELGPMLALEMPAVRAEIQSPAGPLVLYGVHTAPPANGEFSAHRDLQLQELGGLLTAERLPVMVAGDLNASLATPALSALIQEAHLSSPGSIRAGSWPAGFPAVARIRIDHVLLGPGLGAVALEVGGLNGSDHRPLVLRSLLTTETPLHQDR